MIIAFYKVSNSLGYERHTFDELCDQPEKIEEMLQPLLDKDEAAIVNLDDYESVELFADEFNDEVYDDGWWCVALRRKSLEDMISKHSYDEIVSKVKEEVGEEAFGYVFPSIKKTLEEGPAKVKGQILFGWLGVSSVKICTYCGRLMSEGWYLDCRGYACSDECCRILMELDKDEYYRYGIFKDEIETYLREEGKGRTPESLTEDEIKELIEDFSDQEDSYFYTDFC